MLEERAAQALIDDGIGKEDHEIIYQADVRYSGQAFEISLDFTAAELEAEGLAIITGQFDAEHEQLFSFKLDDGHEILMIRAVVKAKATAMATAKVGSDAELKDCIVHESKFHYDGVV